MTDKNKRPPKDSLVRAMARPLELRMDEGAAMPTLTGRFAVFDQWTEIHSAWEGEFMESISKGAFRKTIAEGRDSMKVLFNHGQDMQIGDKVLGAIKVLREDGEGAYYEVPLFDTTYNRDLLPGLEAGVYGASFRFQVVKEEFVSKPKVSDYNPRGIPERIIKEARVMEFGPVTFPAYAGASAGVRADASDPASYALRSLTDSYVLSELTRNPDKLRELLTMTGSRVPELRTVGSEPAALPDAGADAGHSEDEGAAGQGEPVTDDAAARAADEPETTEGASADPDPEPERAAEPQAPDTSKENQRNMKTIEELRARDADITARFAEIHQEYGAQVLPDDVRAEWERIMQERNEGRRAIADYEQRQAQLEAMATGDGNVRHTEPIAAPVSRGSRRGVPDNLFALEEYRQMARSYDDLRQAYRDGAMKVVERANIAHPNVDSARAKERLQRLLDTVDDREGTLAQRFIATGSQDYARAWAKSLRGQHLTSVEERALSLGSDPDGGYNVPFQLDPTVVLVTDGSVNSLRQMARIVQIVGKEWQGITTEGVVVTRTTEGDEATDDAPEFDQPVVRTNRVQGFIPFSIELGQDWAGLQSEMAVLLADAKDEEEADSFVLGDGTGTEPDGIVGALDVASHVQSVANDAFGVGDLYKLEEALGARFRARASWLANRFIYNKVRQFDTAGGANLWVRIGDSRGAELLGYPAFEASAMDASTADDKLPLILGDFSKFLIVDRIGMSTELIPHLFGPSGRPTGQRGLYAIWRNNTKILVDNAFRLLQIQ